MKAIYLVKVEKKINRAALLIEKMFLSLSVNDIYTSNKSHVCT